MFAAGSFRDVVPVFRGMEGVVSTTVGYSGGDLESPTHEEVFTDTTGHALVVLVEFNPAIVPYQALLDAFWGCHDPTTINQQGRDIGTHFRSAIFYYDDEQRAAAIESRIRLQTSGKYRRAIVTEISRAADFWKAAEVHQRIHEKRSEPRAT